MPFLQGVLVVVVCVGVLWERIVKFSFVFLRYCYIFFETKAWFPYKKKMLHSGSTTILQQFYILLETNCCAIFA